jgi:uncharacterized membrane protein YqjE
VGFIVLLLWDTHRLATLAVLALLCLAAGVLLLRAAQRSMQEGGPMLAGTRAEFERDEVALRE